MQTRALTCRLLPTQGANGLIRRPDWEDDHPNVDPWFIPAATPTNMAVSVGSFHPDVGTTYAAGTAVPSDHPSVHASYTAILPTSHPNIDTILADPANNPLPWSVPALFHSPSTLSTQSHRCTYLHLLLIAGGTQSCHSLSAEFCQSRSPSRSQRSTPTSTLRTLPALHTRSTTLQSTRC
jgi:hypothetical protein